MALHVQELPRDELEFQMFVMDELADAARRRGEDVIKLTIGISDLPPPPAVVNALVVGTHDRHLAREVHPEGLPELREAIAGYYHDGHRVAVSPGQVLVGAGTSAIYRNLMTLLCRPGDEVLIPRPYYPLYRISALLAGARVTTYDVDLDTRRIDQQSFRRAFDPVRTAVVVINSPGNPLGNVVDPDEISEMYRVIGGQAHVLMDEIFGNCCFWGPFTPAFSYLPPEARRHTVVTNGFSKGFRLYTKRVGWALLPPELVMPMRIMQQHTLLTQDPVVQSAMVVALADRDSPRELMYVHRARAGYACQHLASSCCSPIAPDGGFHVVLDCRALLEHRGESDTIALSRELLARTGVATVPGTDFGLPETLRLSLCCDRFEEAVDRLAAYLTQREAAPVKQVVHSRQVVVGART